MNKNDILAILNGVKQGEISPNEALERINIKSYEELGFANVDTSRSLRHGVGEVIYGESKNAEQIRAIAQALLDSGEPTVLITRISAEKAEYVGKTINPQVILQAIRQCENTLINKRAEIQEEQEEARRKVEKELASKGLLGVNGWLKYCQRRGITDQPNPMQGFIKDMRKKQFNVK